MTNNGRFVPLKGSTGPTNLCMYTGRMDGDSTGTLVLSAGILFHLSTCGCPSCFYGQLTSVDINTNLIVKPEGYLSVPENVAIGNGISIDLCGTLDGLQRGALKIYGGARFRADYPANSAEQDSLTSSLVIQRVDIFKDSFFETSNLCSSGLKPTLYSDTVNVYYGGNFVQNEFILANTTRVDMYETGQLNHTECPTSGELVLIANQECTLSVGVYHYDAIIVKGGATMWLEGDYNITEWTDIRMNIMTNLLIVEAGGLITSFGEGLPESGEMACTEDDHGSIQYPDFYGRGGTYVRGGGHLGLVVATEMRVDGVIDVSGEDGYHLSSSAGSGGSISITTPTISGFGSIQAEGGSTSKGCGGYGGRIAIHSTSQLMFTGSISVAPGAGMTSGRGGVVFTSDASTSKTKVAIHGSRGIPTVLGHQDLTGLSEIDELVVEDSGYLQLETSLQVRLLKGDQTGRIKLSNGATLEIQDSRERGTECSFEVDYGSELVLGTKIRLTGPTPVLQISGTVSTEHLYVGQSRVADIAPSGVMNVRSITLEEGAALEIQNGGTIGDAAVGNITLKEFEMGASSEVIFGSRTTDVTVEILILRSQAKMRSSAELQRLYIHGKTVILEGDSQISVDSGGHPGEGAGGCTDGSMGGSHGGQGGHAEHISASSCYGAIHKPLNPGSGCSSNGHETRGGGHITIEAVDSLILDGILSARGQDSDGTVGAGSGGSIFIDSPTVSGLGYLVVTGGDASTTGLGGGGGGRIAVDSEQVSEFHGVFDASGGTGFYSGAAGTVAMVDRSKGFDCSLTVDNKGKLSDSYAVLKFHYSNIIYGVVIVQGRGRLTFDTPPDTTLSFTSLEGDLSGLFLIQSNQRVSVAKSFSTNSLYPLQCAIKVEEGGELILPPEVYLLHIPDMISLDLSGTLTGVRKLEVGVEASFLAHPSASTAARDSKDILLFRDPAGTLSLDTAVVHGSGTMSLKSDLDQPMVLVVLQELTIHYSGTLKAVWLQIKADALYVETGGSIDAIGQGWTGMEGPGAGVAGSIGWTGGSYGGAGGGILDYDPHMSLYGSIYEADQFGSGGGGDSISETGTGGGLIEIEASVLRLDGSIDASGLPGYRVMGGGSGGSVNIDVKDEISGAGAIFVVGGDGGEESGGGGSGGRIAVYIETVSAFTGDLLVRGGKGGLETQAGGSGTAYWQESIKGVISSKLFVDNRGVTLETPQITLINETLSELHFNELHLHGDSHLKFVGDLMVSVDRLVSSSGGGVISIHDGMALSVNEGFSEHVFYCSFHLSADGELRLPARTTFNGDSNTFSGSFTFSISPWPYAYLKK